MKLIKFVNLLSDDLKDTGRFRMCIAHQSVVHSVFEFSGLRSLTLNQMYTKDFLHRYEEYLILKGRKRNTISFYMTVLRGRYNTAVKMKKISYKAGLFTGVLTGSDPTRKRAVDPEVISCLYHANLTNVPHLERCRDLFMLSFHLQGMLFVDMAYLRKNDIQEDLAVFRRHKTRSVVSVSILEPAKELFDKYLDETIDSRLYITYCESFRYGWTSTISECIAKA